MVRASSRQGEGRRFESDHSYQLIFMRLRIQNYRSYLQEIAASYLTFPGWTYPNGDQSRLDLKVRGVGLSPCLFHWLKTEVIKFLTCDSNVATLGSLAGKNLLRKCVQKDDESHVFAIIRVLA